MWVFNKKHINYHQIKLIVQFLFGLLIAVSVMTIIGVKVEENTMAFVSGIAIGVISTALPFVIALVPKNRKIEELNRNAEICGNGHH